MDLGLMGKRVLISGGTSGIGLSAAEEFLNEGAKVMLMGRSHERGRLALQALSSYDAQVEFFPGDVTHPEDCAKVISHTDWVFGGIDIVVTSAGVYGEGPLVDMSVEEIETIINTNLLGTIYLTRAALPYLKKTQGSIVTLASDAGVHANYCTAAYCAAKGGVVLYTRALALETANDGVRVNAVAPGDVLTPMTEAQLASIPESRDEALQEMASCYPLGRIATPEEVSALIVFLCSDRAGFQTGGVYPVDGGLTA